MYTSFSIKNFRGFEDFQLADLARINLIAGKNNTGKTSLLEAIVLHSGHFSPELLLRDSQVQFDKQRAIVYFTTEAFPGWNFVFCNFDSSMPILLLGQYRQRGDDHLTRRALVESQLTISLVSANEEPLPDHKVARSVDLSDDFGIAIQEARVLRITYQNADYFMTRFEDRVRLNKFAQPLFPVIFFTAREGIAAKDNAARFSGLKRARQVQVLVDALRVIEPRLESLELFYDGDPPMIYGEVGLREPIPLAAMGEGMVRIASLVLAIGSASGGVVAIDEIENGLHYSVLTDVWKAIATAAREFEVQIFATTHSLECINAAHQAFSEAETYDFRLHRLDLKSDGMIRPVTFDQETLQAALEADFEVR